MAFSLRRLHCHFCGTRSPHTKSSGIPEFECASCEAVNFLDSKGNITDTPASVATQSAPHAQAAQPAFNTFTFDPPEALHHQQAPAFCDTCVKNQQIYLQTLSSYLPDEDHPEYQKYEDGLPRFKQDLEKRYPQICARCAPKAQNKIHRADYYAGTQNVAMLGRKTQARRGASARGMRDDWFKWTMRQGLDLVGWMCYASLLAQIAWHVYGMFAAVSNHDTVASDFAFDATVQSCISSTLARCFDQTCHSIFGTYMTRALFTSACLLWYNTGLKDWFHHTHRMETVNGQMEYLRMQLLMLVVRAIAFYKLSDAEFATDLSTQQSLAVNGFVVIFMVLVQWMSERAIKPIIFKLKLNNMMPKPEERDVLGAWAGPARESSTPHASSVHPSHLFARDRISPFPIANLASKQNVHAPSAIPSPPPSDETDDEGSGVEDMDWQPTVQSKMPGARIDRTFRPRGPPSKPKQQQPAQSMFNSSNIPSLGWSGMRDSLFGIQDNIQLETERQRLEADERTKLRYEPPTVLNPFRGTLPQAPMSMGKRLRNPISQVSFKKAPEPKQQDFMAQIRSGIEQSKSFTRQQESTRDRQAGFAANINNDSDDVRFTPAKLRTRGVLELKKSEWTLPSDTRAATGLEDLFGGSTFRIADRAAPASAAVEEEEEQRRRTRENSSRMMMMKMGLMLAVSVLVVIAL